MIHQTWKNATPPRDKGDPDSWRRLNPGWTYRLWTDEDLDAFMAAEFPALMPLYRSYPNPVQRADLGRYCLLARLGGVYADIDTDCLAPLEPLAGDPRAVFCTEPSEHDHHATSRGMPRLWFNGTMASPPGHPIWDEVIRRCERVGAISTRDVLESTGPLVLSAAIEAFPEPERLSLNSCHLFAPVTWQGQTQEDPEFGPHAALRLSRHNWAGTWFKVWRVRRLRRWKGHLRRWMVQARWGRGADPAQVLARLDRDLLARPLPPADPAPQVVFLVPVRDGAPFLDRNIELLRALDYPKDRLRIVYCEGDSRDDSAARIAEIRVRYGAEFAGIEHLTYSAGLTLPREGRWKPKYQRARRAALARVRNEMIRQGLQPGDDWVFWLDVDVCEMAPDTLRRMLSERAPIVMANCVLDPGGPSFDLNAFLELGRADDEAYYKAMRHGIFQPPFGYWHRRSLSELRYLDRVLLHGVGGTALLVQADLHRAGILFPETPYRDLLETEALGYLARDAGIVPIGLPNVEVRHVKS